MVVALTEQLFLLLRVVLCNSAVVFMLPPGQLTVYITLLYLLFNFNWLC